MRITRYATCHKERKHWAKGLCNSCYSSGIKHEDYDKTYYQKNRATIRARSRKNYLANREARNKQNLANYYKEENYPAIILSRIRVRARKHNIPFDLTVDDIILPSVCPVLGVQLKRNYGGTAHPNSYSVDRLNPVLGYTKGNIMIMSYKANCMKSNATPSELLKFAQWVNETIH